MNRNRKRAVFFSSDLHLGHENVIRYCNRPFADIEEMNRVLIENINKTVGVEDELWVLGDFAFKISREETAELRKKIHCRHVHLIVGNHDRKNYENDGIFESVQHYKELKTEDGGRVILFHYPIADWNGRAYGVPLLHGHIHSTGEYNESNRNLSADECFQYGHSSRVQGLCHRAYDVGVDANNYRPISLEDILNFWNGN